MKFHEQKLLGVYIIEPESLTDDRGVFRRHFCDQEFSKNNIVTDVRQSNISENNSDILGGTALPIW